MPVIYFVPYRIPGEPIFKPLSAIMAGQVSASSVGQYSMYTAVYIPVAAVTIAQPPNSRLLFTSSYMSETSFACAPAVNNTLIPQTYKMAPSFVVSNT